MEIESHSGNILIQFLVIFFLILINAFFASAEIAIVSLNKNKIKLLLDQGNKKAELLVQITEEPTKFLSTIQVGITLAGFFSSASAATGISDDLAQILSKYNVPYNKTISIIFVTLILSYITLVFGELFPKRIALQKAEKIAMLCVKPITYISKLTMPFVKLLSLSTNILVELAGLDKEDLNEKVLKEEIRSLINVGQEHGAINEIEKDMINSIFKFDDIIASQVMTPRTEVYLINIEVPLSEYLDELLEEHYSRIPVYQGDIDNIIGILYMKDFLVEAKKYGFKNVDIKSILQPPYFVPETKNIDDLFREFQASKKHMAILIDEYGGFSGIVTIEDLIEEIMGNIADEYDDDEPEIQKVDNHTYIVDGMLSIDDLNEYFGADIPKKDYDTVSGFILDILGCIPENTEEFAIEYENLLFKIISIKEKRIERIKISIRE